MSDMKEESGCAMIDAIYLVNDENRPRLAM